MWRPTGLPQVSWIVPPYRLCEHPDASPAAGEWFTARMIAALTANPKVWAKTVFILNYDENDGFFDHVPPPLPAVGAALGKSTGEDRRRGLSRRAGGPRSPRADDRRSRPGPRAASSTRGLRPHLGDPVPRGPLRRGRAAHHALATHRLWRPDQHLRLQDSEPRQGPRAPRRRRPAGPGRGRPRRCPTPRRPRPRYRAAPGTRRPPGAGPALRVLDRRPASRATASC
jgi:hypothetical protein